ncbi:MAG: hypothetical protein J0H98_01625 [Solirubrobacterales bacterium]|nr:hypothetical protein [Solirubrobacterales bacterium]
MIDRIRNWRLPVRYKVPPRNDLIAFALMALAFGLMVGLAIAPGWGNADPTGPVVALPAQEATTADSGDTAVPLVAADLQPPAGAEPSDASGGPDPSSTPSGTPVSDPGPDTSGDPAPSDPAPPADDDYKDPPEKDPPADESDDGPALIATVVGADPAGYAVADPNGNLLYIHHPLDGLSAPKPGRKVGTGIDPLANGTFVQNGGLENQGPIARTKLTGTVSWIDREDGVITVSARGVSLALRSTAASQTGAEAPTLGSLVTGTLVFGAAEAASTPDETEEEPLTVPALEIKSLEVLGSPQTQVDLAGPVEWDPAARVLAIDADGFGTLNRQVEVAVPKKLALKKIQNGQSYAISAEIGSDGTLTLVGLSANFSREAAADPAQAFGTHAS